MSSAAVETIDVAIIGGGVGGVYTAWRLQNDYATGRGSKMLPGTDGNQLKIRIYEGSNRIGGRLESLVPPGAPHLMAEFGGMGYSTNHVRVKNLVENKLQLPTKPFVSSTPESIFYLRRKRFRQAEDADPSVVPYNLPPGESGKSYDTILEDAVEGFLPGMTTWSDVQWYDEMYFNRTFRGLPMYEVSLWDVLLGLMSNEAYNLIEDSMGHMPFLGAWNAAEALPWNFIDSRPGTELKTIIGGYDLIPLTLYNQYIANGGECQMNTKLVWFQEIIGAPEPLIGLRFNDGTQVNARVVVLAMPRRSLELIAQDTPLQIPSVQQLIKTVTPVPHMKIFMAYDRPWWEQAGVYQGHSNTDLPLRTTYYEGTESRAGGDPNNNNSLLMAVYTDGRYVRFWEGLQQGAMYPDQPNPFLTPPTTPDYWHEQPIASVMVDELQRQLAEMHGLDQSAVPMPYTAAWKDWRDDPFGGAWNSWNVGVNALKTVPQMIQPLPNLNMLICGSAYSHWQGWVEGALETCELMLQSRFGLQPPNW